MSEETLNPFWYYVRLTLLIDRQWKSYRVFKQISFLILLAIIIVAVIIMLSIGIERVECLPQDCPNPETKAGSNAVHQGESGQLLAAVYDHL